MRENLNTGTPRAIRADDDDYPHRKEATTITLDDPDRCFTRGEFTLRKVALSVTMQSCPEHLAEVVDYLIARHAAVSVVVFPTQSTARCDYRYPERTDDDRKASHISTA
jgi:hypothetical protein